MRVGGKKKGNVFEFVVFCLENNSPLQAALIYKPQPVKTVPF
jgi:hypothetical protein